MKLLCAPNGYPFPSDDGVLEVILYGKADIQTRGAAGAALKREVLRRKLKVEPRAWDFLSIALSVTAADLAGHRSKSPDGWTRDFDLQISVTDPDFWNSQSALLEKLLAFLTTDRWQVRFLPWGGCYEPTGDLVSPDEDCVTLLSGGLDSLVGAIDLVEAGKRPFALSQTVTGDAENQVTFARGIGGGLRHLQVNHNAEVPGSESPPSQRARSLVFLSYGVFAATTLARHHAGESVTLYVCENGFISVNPPLTGGRLGSLSTRTTHPFFLKLLQQLIDGTGLRVRFENPYQLKTKGEMLRECTNSTLLRTHASNSTSCGRFRQFGFTHCGRCVPCLVRRSAFLTSGISDGTNYKHVDLGRDDEQYAGFDDVRSVAMALAEVEADGLDSWIGTALSTALSGDIQPLRAMVGRGLEELRALFSFYGVQ
jgi:7-cyano-7-deazaguanine synthase in queuosine biosynthesis